MPGTSTPRDAIDLTSSPPLSPVEDNRINVPDSDEEDEELKLAIALSLQQKDHSQHEDHSAELTEVGSKEEDADLKNAIALSLEQEPASTPVQQLSATDIVERTAPMTSTGIGSFLGLDRKEMEAERLARLKRKRGDQQNYPRPVSPPPSRRVKEAIEALAFAALKTSLKSQARPYAADPAPTSDSPNSTAMQLYPQGKVYKTYAEGYSAEGTITFSKLIAPTKGLKFALLSSYIWDFDWLFPHFNTKTTRFLLVMHAKYPGQRVSIQNDFAGIPNISLCFPPMEGMVNCMHSKLMLLFWDDRCRLVVPTANLMGFDWGVGSVMENTVWLMDLPLRAAAAQTEQTPFQSSLKQFLQAQTVPEEVLTRLDLFDFEETRKVGFVHTIGGVHSGESWRDTGHCGLGKVVSELGLGSTEPIEVDFVASSVGSLSEEFMRCLYLAAQGDDGLTEYTLRTSKGVPAKRAGTAARPIQTRSGSEWGEHFRFYFPSHDTVTKSNGGPDSAGTICFSKRWWEGPKFPRASMRECISTRDGLLMHNKILFVRFPQPRTIDERSCVGFAYVGSANISESAWGRLVQDKSSRAPKLNCRNWECGIVIPAFGMSTLSSPATHLKPSGLKALGEVIPVPMEMPATTFQDSGRVPWFGGGEM